MKKISRMVIGSVGLVAMLSLVALAYGESGGELFDKLCSDCHTIGSGDKGGPDLAQVTEKRRETWLAQIITAPDKLTAANDPLQLELTKKYGFEMPNLGVSRDDVLKIITFFKETGKAGGQATGVKAAGGRPAPQETLVTPELVARGKALFIGGIPFNAGGPPCATCHPFHAPGIIGGSLARDLTDHYHNMGEAAFATLKFPVMRKIFADRALTPEEVSALIVFAKDAAAREKQEESMLFPSVGFGLFGSCLIFLFFYKRRFR